MRCCRAGHREGGALSAHRTSCALAGLQAQEISGSQYPWGHGKMGGGGALGGNGGGMWGKGGKWGSGLKMSHFSRISPSFPSPFLSFFPSSWQILCHTVSLMYLQQFPSSPHFSPVS